MELVEGGLYETPDGRRYVAGFLEGKGWGLRPYPTTRARLSSCADYAGRARAAVALLADILVVEEATGRPRRLILCPPVGPVQRLIARSQRVATEPEATGEATGWTVADLIHRGPRPA